MSASAYDAAAQGIILLKNDRKHLPLSLDQGLTVAVIGPHANSSTGHDSPGLLGSYNNEDNIAVLNQTMLLAVGHAEALQPPEQLLQAVPIHRE